jgi:hypothetical protein
MSLFLVTRLHCYSTRNRDEISLGRDRVFGIKEKKLDVEDLLYSWTGRAPELRDFHQVSQDFLTSVLFSKSHGRFSAMSLNTN